MEDIGFDTAGLDERSVEEVRTRPAVEFVAALHRRFDSRRVGLLDARAWRAAASPAAARWTSSTPPGRSARIRPGALPRRATTTVTATPGEVTEAGVRGNLGVAFRYISFWLGGRGAAAIDNLMEDAATAEICRAQIWQWIRHGAKLEDGRTITEPLVRGLLAEELARIESEVGEETWNAGHPQPSLKILEAVALGDSFPDFLTLVSYELLEGEPAR